ncbi:MAG: 5-carboxymethyl-2-hydroxymuconate Delta-isomerase [Granulosicoccus sp.]
MPHIIIEYSANVETLVDLSALCEATRLAAVGIKAFPMPGIRVRALRADHYAIADGNPKHGFVDISVRLRAGREQQVKKDAVQDLFHAVKQFLEPVMLEHSLALSLEMRDIDPELSPKTGTIRDHL